MRSAGMFAHRVIERFHLDFGVAQELLARQVLEPRVAAHRQVRAIELHERGPTSAIASYSLLHHLGERFHVLLVRRVVLVRLEHRDGAGRDGGHEPFGDLAPSTAPLHAGDVLRQRRIVLDRDRPLADRPLVGGRVPFLHQSIAERRKVVEVLRRRARRIAFEAGQAMADVGGVADLARSRRR